MNIGWLWEWYKTIVGITTIVLMAIIVLSFIFLYLYCWRPMWGNCPICGGRKFWEVVGGPPQCVKCGWQYDKSFFGGEAAHPNFKERGYYIVNWWPKKNCKIFLPGVTRHNLLSQIGKPQA